MGNKAASRRLSSAGATSAAAADCELKSSSLMSARGRVNGLASAHKSPDANRNQNSVGPERAAPPGRRAPPPADWPPVEAGGAHPQVAAESARPQQPPHYVAACRAAERPTQTRDRRDPHRWSGADRDLGCSQYANCAAGSFAALAPPPPSATLKINTPASERKCEPRDLAPLAASVSRELATETRAGGAEKPAASQQQQQQQQQHRPPERRPQEPAAQRNSEPAAREPAAPLAWTELALRYGKMPRKQHRASLGAGWRNSRYSQLLLALLHSLLPIAKSLDNYKLPADLATDLFAGLTIGVLHIPQGMAYGLLAGVDPIFGLYTSLFPVLVMALMSRSRHVSYGTFAVVSMLLANAIGNVRANLSLQQQRMLPQARAPQATSGARALAESALAPDQLVVTDNHQPLAADASSRQLFENMIAQSAADEAADTLSPPPLGADELDAPSNIEILGCVCLLAGAIQVSMSLMRLGHLSLVFSDQLVSSFTTAAAVHVVTSQLGGLFDLTLPPIAEDTLKIYYTWRAVFLRLGEGFNAYAALLSLASILFLLAVKQLLEPRLRARFKSLTCLPSELLLMVVVIACSWYWNFRDSLGLKTVGHVPTGLPAPQAPRLELAPFVAQDALTVALVSFAMNLSLAQVYAKRFKYKLEPNQELLALGTSNVVSSFFSCFPCGSSLSRTAVQSSLNARSQLSALFSCAIVLSIICFFAPILHDLPRSTLSCIIVVALKGILAQITDLRDNWRLSKLDALVWVVTFLAVLVFNVTYGLLLGICASLFMIFFRLLTPNHSILGRLPGTEIYVDSSAFDDCAEIEQVKIFRFNSALCYLNRTVLRSRVEKSLPSVFKPQGLDVLCSWRRHDALDESNKTRYLIIDCSALAYCDYSGAATLVEIIEELEEEHKLNVFLAACPIKLVDMLEKMLRTDILKRNVYPSITDAVSRTMYLKSLRGRASNHSPRQINDSELDPYPMECIPIDRIQTCESKSPI